ncbi:UNVERIFIED_CONTAM: 26S proteasome regulatory subunitBA [Sesamum calycinum]
MIMATNRPDVLDPALLRPGRLDRKIEIPLPNEQSRMEILKIHAAGIAKHGEIDYEAVVKLAEGFNGADLRNICTEAGMSAIRAERDYVIHEDFMKRRNLNPALTIALILARIKMPSSPHGMWELNRKLNIDCHFTLSPPKREKVRNKANEDKKCVSAAAILCLPCADEGTGGLRPASFMVNSPIFETVEQPWNRGYT